MNASLARRMLVAVSLVGAVLGTTGGHAVEAQAPVAPVLVATSVDSGFASRNPIAARFDKTLSPTLSTASLRDKNDVEVASTTIRTSSGMGPDGDSLVLTPNYNALSETLSPYRVTFTAFEQTGSGTPGSVAVSKSFTFDLERPEVAITTPSDAGTPRVVAPEETLAIGGYAFDRSTYDNVGGNLIERTANRSGLARVEIQYYKLNPSVRPPSVTPGAPPSVTTDPPGANPGTPPTVVMPLVQPSQEVASLRHNAALAACTRTSCVPGEQAWAANTDGLTTGSWTARAYAIDVAGNRSMVAETSFILL